MTTTDGKPLDCKIICEHPRSTSLDADLQVLMDDVLVRDDRAVYHWTLTAANTGPGGTGKRIRISGFEVWRIGDDGLIAESRGHFDSADYQRQLESGVQDRQ